VEKPDVAGFDAVIHLAGLSNDVLGELNPSWTYEINHAASVRLAEIAKSVGVGRFIFASSCSLYGAAGDAILDEQAPFNPITAYAKSKVLVERDLRQLAGDGFSPIYLRNATAYGVSPRIRFDLVINNLTAWAYATGAVHLKSDGTPWRPVVHIGDISRAAAVLAAPRDIVHDQAYNIGVDSENYTIRELAAIVQETVPNCEIRYADNAGPTSGPTGLRLASTPRPSQRTPSAGMPDVECVDIYHAYRRTGLGRDDYEGPKFQRLAQLQYLLRAGQLDETLRWADRAV